MTEVRQNLRKVVAIAICLAGSATICFAQEKGVEINGVIWATCNVDAPGKFAAKPESPGKFYQWNRKVAWGATGDVTNWNTSEPAGTEWDAANDPSPAGWRIPTLKEIQSLVEEDKVKQKWDDTKKGITFTDKESGASIFIPAVGYREPKVVTTLFGTVIKKPGALSREEGNYPEGFYWSSTQYPNPYNTEEQLDQHNLFLNHISILRISSLFASASSSPRVQGCIIRPVSMEKAALPPWKSNITGVWKGNFGSQMQSKATFTVNDDMTGVFDFESNGKTGKFKVSIKYANGTYSVEGTEWIEQTGNFGFFNFEGQISDNTFSGSNFKFEK